MILIVPQEGTLKIMTEFGKMIVAPREICVIQVIILLLYCIVIMYNIIAWNSVYCVSGWTVSRIHSRSVQSTFYST